MDIENLGQLVKKELGRNKAKSAFLATMFGVAIYMWSPQVAKWMRSGSNADSQPVVTVLDDSPQPKENEPFAIHWDQLARWRRENPLMHPVAAMGDNPFTPIPIAEVAMGDRRVNSLDAEENLDEAEPPAPLPEDDEWVEFVLSGVIFGRSHRVATLNGQRYREGDEIYVEESAGDYILERIHRDHVFVTRGEERRRLDLNADWATMKRRVAVEVIR